jgi:hypothetical protein
LAYALNSGGTILSNLINQMAIALTWISVFVCVIRGVPVLIEGIKTIKT